MPIAAWLVMAVHFTTGFAGMHQAFARRFSWPVTLLCEAASALLAGLIAFAFPLLPLLFGPLAALLFFAVGQWLFVGPWAQKLAVELVMLLCTVIASYIVIPVLPQGSLRETLLTLPLMSLVCVTLLLAFTDFSLLCAEAIIVRILLHRGIEGVGRIAWMLFLIFPLSEALMIDYTVPVGPEAAQQAAYLAAAVGLSIGADMLIGHAVQSVSRNAALQTQYKALYRQIDSQTAYYRQIADYYETLRAMRHDMNNHVYTMKILLQEGRDDEAAAYAAKLKEAGIAEQSTYCAHPIADLFLSQKLVSLRERGVTTTTHLDIPASLKLKNGDLLCAIGCLLDGAASECLHTAEHGLLLTAVYGDHALTLTARGAYSEDAEADEQDGNRYLLERLAARCGGTVNAATEAGQRTVRVVLQEAAA